MAIGRISGPMLFNNLERQGVDLAFQGNLLYLDVNNLRVGIINSNPQYTLDASGNVKLSNIIIQGDSITANTGRVNLGSTSNFTISGGALNYVLTTDGAGNISWNEISQLDSQWGNLLLANNTISIANIDGNLNLAANGTGSVVTTNNFYAGNVYALNITGNVTSNAGSFVGNVESPYFIGNLVGTTLTVTSGTVTTGNAATWYATNLNSTDGNITTLVTTNLSTGNAVITGGYISGLSNITATTGNVESWYATTLNSTSANLTTAVVDNFSTGNALVTAGVISNVNLQANNFSTGNAVITGGYISGLSNITATTGNVESWYATTLNSTSANIITGNIANFSTANAQIASGNVTANISGNITGSFGVFSGNVNSSWLVGNVDGSIGNFGNVNVSSNLTVAGNLIASGNVIAQKLTSPTGDLHLSAATNDPNNIIRFDSISALDIASGTTAQRPPNPDAGYLRYNTTLNTIEWWASGSWVAGANPITSQIITPDGISASFSLTQSTTQDGILVNINGTVQQPGLAYTVSGTQITFTEVPQTTDIIDIRYISAGTVSSFSGGNVAGSVRILSTADSTSSSTGALIVDGGAGIAGNINVSGNIGVASTSGTPLDTVTPTGWLKIYVNSTAYFLPLYQ